MVSTVKDKSVFVAKPDLAFSQLFFPVKGILAIYHRNSGAFQSLPGADDPEYVQSNPGWSPDGKYIVFARSQSLRTEEQEAEDELLLSEEDCAEFLRGGEAIHCSTSTGYLTTTAKAGKRSLWQGASRNGRSNYFAQVFAGR